ncbi:hypothetical protein V8E55_004511 [Tylopilus felleus]|jgi:hypothetical protein
MTQTPRSYDDRVRSHLYNSTIPGTENMGCVSGTHPRLLPVTTPQLDVDVAHPYNYAQPPHLSPASAPRHNEFDPPSQLMHLSHSPLPIGNEPLDHPPTACGNFGFPQPSEFYSPWDSFHTSPDLLPNVICNASLPTLQHIALNPTVYANVPCNQSPWSTGDVRVGSVDGVVPAPTNHDLLAFPFPDSAASSHTNLDNISETYSGVLDASYPCLWTKGGIICNVMVPATRSHMNRHLHAYHGFCGSDTQQTTCHWAGCDATMQQGSIARHMVTCHLQAKVTCPMCSKKLSRQDVISKHQRVCPAAGTWG